MSFRMITRPEWALLWHALLYDYQGSLLWNCLLYDNQGRYASLWHGLLHINHADSTFSWSFAWSPRYTLHHFITVTRWSPGRRPYFGIVFCMTIKEHWYRGLNMSLCKITKVGLVMSWSSVWRKMKDLQCHPPAWSSGQAPLCHFC